MEPIQHGDGAKPSDWSCRRSPNDAARRACEGLPKRQDAAPALVREPAGIMQCGWSARTGSVVAVCEWDMGHDGSWEGGAVICSGQQAARGGPPAPDRPGAATDAMHGGAKRRCYMIWACYEGVL